MTEPVLFADAELVVVTALRSRLAASDPYVDVGTLVPNPRPDRLVVVQRTGGARLNLVADEPTVTVDAWAPTADEAQGIAQRCRAHLHALRGSTVAGVAVYRVQELAGPQNLPDPLSSSPRYTFAVSLALRGTALEEGS